MPDGYRYHDHRLYDPAGRLLLGGPTEEIAAFATALNARPPADEAALRGALLDLVEGTSDCSFAPYLPLTAAEDAAVQALAQRLAEPVTGQLVLL